MSRDKVTGREYPTIEIAGKEYTLKPIPASMAFDLAVVIESGFGALSRMDMSNPQQSGQQMMQLFSALLRQNKDLFTSLFAHVLGVKESDFKDGQRFPLSSFVRLAKALAEHPDVKDFFAELQEAMSSIGDEQSEKEKTSSQKSSDS